MLREILALVATAAAAEAVPAAGFMERERFAERDVLVPDPAMDRDRNAGTQASQLAVRCALRLATFMVIHGYLLWKV